MFFMALFSVACADSGPGGPRLKFVMRADSMSLYDTMTVSLKLIDGRGDSLDAPGAAWSVSDSGKMSLTQSVIRFPRAIAFGRDTGAAWVIAETKVRVDSARVRIVLMPFRTAGYLFYDDKNVISGPNKRYHPFDGMCFTFTTETFKQKTGRDYWYNQVGAFVVDALRHPLFRGPTEWSYSNPSVLEIAPAKDSIYDVLMRPASKGYTAMKMRVAQYVGRVDVFVDPVNECRGIVPGLVVAVRLADADPPVYLW